MNKYPFLELLTESDAMARGANLNDKITHTVFKTIKGLSTPESIRGGKFFTLDTFVPDILNLTKRDLTQVVNRLISDKLVLELFYLEYDSATRRMIVHPNFISLPPEKDQMNAVYSGIIRYSIASIEEMLETRPGFDARAFQKDLEKDFTSRSLPGPGDLPATSINPFQEVHAGNFDINPVSEMLKASTREIADELVRSGEVVDLQDFGLMPVREEELLERFETARNFLMARLIPRYKNKGNLKGELERINLAESDYFSAEKVPDAASFAAERAEAIKKTLRAQPRQEQERGVTFPGSLAIEVILVLKDVVERLYAKRWDQECEKTIKEFVGGLMRRDGTWADMMRTLEYREIYQFPADVWQKLTNHHEIQYSSFERKAGHGRVHVFIRRDTQAFRSLVAGLMDAPPAQLWKILALKFVLEKYEADYQELFQDQEFVRAYGRVLRRVYINYIPWFYRLLMMLGINVFQDSAFKIAKEKVAQEQRVLAARNQTLIAEAEKEREEERKINRIKLKDKADSNKIIEKLDLFFHDQLYVPSAAEVEHALEEEKFNFEEVTGRLRFIFTAAGSERLLLYPVDHEWRTRIARLERSLEKMKEKYSVQSSRSAQDQIARIAALEKLMQSAESRKETPEDKDEPYRKLALAIKKEEARMQVLDAIEGQDEDLDV